MYYRSAQFISNQLLIPYKQKPKIVSKTLISEKNALKMSDIESILVNFTSNHTNFNTLARINIQKSWKSNRLKSNEFRSSRGPSGGLYDAVDLQLDAGVVAFAINDDTSVKMEPVESRCPGDKRSNWQVEVAVIDFCNKVEDGKGDALGIAHQRIGAFLNGENGHNIRPKVGICQFPNL